MEIVGTIIAALVAGATAAAKDTATKAVKDAYDGLKFMLSRHFSGNAAARSVIDAVDTDPAKAGELLRPLLTEAPPAQNAPVVTMAEELKKAVERDDSQTYSVVFQGQAVGTIVHNAGTVSQTFTIT